MLFVFVGKVHKGIDDVVAFEVGRVGCNFVDVLLGDAVP